MKQIYALIREELDTKKRTYCVMFIQVKKTEKNNGFKKKNMWPLKELKLVDGIDGIKVRCFSDNNKFAFNTAFI